MLTSEAIKVVEARFRSGEIPKEELLLHVEPMLEGLARDRAEHEEVRRLVNAIEVAIYTEPDVRLRDAVADCLRVAIEFAQRHEVSVESECSL